MTAAARALHDVATFDSAGVTEKDRAEKDRAEKDPATEDLTESRGDAP